MEDGEDACPEAESHDLAMLLNRRSASSKWPLWSCKWVTLNGLNGTSVSVSKIHRSSEFLKTVFSYFASALNASAILE